MHDFRCAAGAVCESEYEEEGPEQGCALHLYGARERTRMKPALGRALWLRRENGSWIEEICMESKCNMNVFSGWLRKDGVWKAECEREVKLVRAE